MTVELTVLIGLVCSVIGGAVGLMAHRRNRNKDVAEDAKSNGIVLTEIGYIKSGVDDIKRKQDKQDDRTMALSDRVTTVEASAKQAHKRIDEIQSK